MDLLLLGRNNSSEIEQDALAGTVAGHTTQLADIATDMTELQNTGVDAVARGQLETVYPVFTRKPSGKNLFDFSAISNNMELRSDGTIAVNSGYMTTDYIDVKYLDKIFTSRGSSVSGRPLNRAVAIYDQYYRYIAGTYHTYFTQPVVMPVDARFLRITTSNDNTNYQIERGTAATTYEAFLSKTSIKNVNVPVVYPSDVPDKYHHINPWYGKRMAVDGDSITDQTTGYWWSLVCDKLGMIGVKHAIGGSTIAVREADPLTKTPIVSRYMTINRITGTFNTSAGSNQVSAVNGSNANFPLELRVGDTIVLGGETHMVEAIIGTGTLRTVNSFAATNAGAYITVIPDLIMIAGGSNDWAYAWTPIGAMNDRTIYTFYGALHVLCAGLLDMYIGKQIVFSAPIKRGSGGNNTLGLKLEYYVGIIKEVCGYYGIPVIDMYHECHMNPQITTQKNYYFESGDDTHPNMTYGHPLMANIIAGKLRQIG